MTINNMFERDIKLPFIKRIWKPTTAAKIGGPIREKAESAELAAAPTFAMATAASCDVGMIYNKVFSYV